MRLLLEAILFGIGGLGAISFTGYFLKAKMLPSSPDNCRHKRWSPWKIEQTVSVHTYSEVDEGTALPDRVDAYMTRTCRSCGMPQAKTVRGIDSPHYK